MKGKRRLNLMKKSGRWLLFCFVLSVKISFRKVLDRTKEQEPKKCKNIHPEGRI